MKTIEQEIKDTAYQFLGEEEIRGNLGFKSERFQELIEAVGWQKGQAWCSYFIELVWRYAYGNQNSIIAEELESVFSAGVVKTLNNFKKDGKYIVSNTPMIGAIAIWQKYYNDQPHWSGHAGVVTKFSSEHFYSIEGNTNGDGSREGYEVALRIRKYNFAVGEGLRLKGFIHPITP